MESWAAVDVKCPFFLSEDGRSKLIRCEGFTDDCTTMIKFRNGGKKAQHMGIFCNDRYACCEIYRATIQAKYP